ncbi:MAG: energy transducer TonB [Candidatus Firestonebacteria bacterium]
MEVSYSPFAKQKPSPGKTEETRELKASKEVDVKINKGEVQSSVTAGKEQAAADGAAVQGQAAFLDMLTVWKSEVRLRIRKALKYPKLLRELNLEGTVTVDFTVDRAGHPANIIITSSSGVKTLDDTAVRTVSRAAPYPSPLEFGEEKYSVSIPIAFKLTE